MAEGKTPEAMAAERDQAKAEVAFTHYYALGPNRTLAALLRKFQAMAQDPRYGPEDVPSRHKPDLTRWRSAHDWDARCLELAQAETAQTARDLGKVRRQALDSLADLSPKAIAALEYLLTDASVKPKERLTAAEAVLNRLGVADRAADAPERAPAAPVLPPLDASDDVLERYYAEHGNR